MNQSNARNSSISIALYTLVSLLIVAMSGLAKGQGPGGTGMDLDVACEFVENGGSEGFRGLGLVVAGAVSGASVGDQVCRPVVILLEQQGKGPWTTLTQVSADLAGDGSFSQLVPLCEVVSRNPDAKVVRVTGSVFVSATNCTDGSMKTLVARCTDSRRQGNRPAISLPSGSELDALCADANI